MCGIAGIYRKDNQTPDQATVRAMAKALRHRGPDGEGFFFDGPAGLAHTRLAIIDVDGGDQPLFRERDRLRDVLIGNGEIYNYMELLAAEGPDEGRNSNSDFEAVFRSGNPAEPAGTVPLRGMYALALYREPRATDADGGPALFLARDPFGIKPLYRLDTDEFTAFASEPRAFFAAGLATPRVNGRHRDALLRLNYVPDTATVYHGISRVPGGATVSFQQRESQAGDGGRADGVPNPIPDVGQRLPADLDAAVEEFDQVFEDSVRIHQRADVPYGMFLSGGVDSGAVLTMMARLNDTPVTAFTCGFSGTGVADERPSAAALADALGANHIEVEFSEADFWSLLPAIADAFDDPTIDYAVLPTYKLAAEARKHVKVVLSGEGGDEIFAGYGRYRKLLRPRWLGGRPPGNDSVFDGLGVLRDPDPDWAASITAIRDVAARRCRDTLKAAQMADILGWLPADLLLKLDRCLMAHGVEGRTPFVDREVARFGFHLPQKFKIHRNRGKRVVREWLARTAPAGYLAQVDPFARKKGFTVPVGEWIARRGEDVGTAIAGLDAIGDIAEPQKVRDLFSGLRRDPGGKPGRAAWALLFYALWHRRHVEGAAVTEDALDFLRS